MRLKNEEVKMQTRRKKDIRDKDIETERSHEYKVWIPRIGLIGMTYRPLVSMTAVVTFGKWLHLVHDTATSTTGDENNIPLKRTPKCL